VCSHCNAVLPPHSIALAGSLRFSAVITDRVRDFTGREWAFKAIDDWLTNAEGPRIFFLTGAPGSGKTTLAARLAQIAQGEVHLPDGLSRLTPGFLSAIHFCSASERRWINPHVFTESLALQLAARYPAYAKALAEKSGDQQIHIDVEQCVHDVAGGQVIGVYISKLDVSDASPEDSFIRVVREPLEALVRQEPSQPIVILVDALDEALLYRGEVCIVDLIAQADYLPSGVCFIVTSRPVTEVLRPLRRSRLGLEERSLTEGAGLTQGLDDVRRHVLSKLDERPELADKLAADLSQVAFAATVRDKSEGNFLYVRYLLEMLVSQRAQIDRGALDGLPVGLEGVYIAFLERIVQGDREAWRERYAPVLGILAVAQQALTEEQLGSFGGIKKGQVRDILTALRQLLDMDESLPASQRTYTLYHRTFADFLLDEDRAEEYWCERQEQLQRIINHYRGKVPYWDAVDWHQVDDYGLMHLATHLYDLIERAIATESKNNVAIYCQDFYGLICKPFMWAKFARFKSHQPFVTDLNLVRTIARAVVPDIIQEIRTNLIQSTLGEFAGNISSQIIAALVQGGEIDRARGYAALASAPIEAYCALGEALLLQGKPEVAKEELLKALAAIQAMDDAKDRAEALYERAMLMVQAGLQDDICAAVGTIPENERVKALEGVANALTQVADKAHLTQMLGVAERMQDPFFKAKALSCVAQALARLGEYEQAVAAIALMGDQTDELVPIAATLTQAGQIDRALALSTSVDTEYEQALVLGGIAHALAQHGGPEGLQQALSIAETITHQERKARALVGIAQVVAQREDKDNLSAVVHKALSVIGAIKHTKWRGHLYPSYPRSSIVRRDIGRIVGGLERERQRIELLCDLAPILAQRGDTAGLTRIVALVRRATGKHLDEITGVSLIWREFQMREEGRKQPSDIDVLSYSGSYDTLLRITNTTGKILGIVAPALAQHGKYRQALAATKTAAAEAAIGKYWRAYALGKVAQQLARAGQGDRALGVVGTIQELSEQSGIFRDMGLVPALSDVACGLIEVGDRRRLQQVLTMLEARKGTSYVAMALGEIARALAHAGDRDGVRRMLAFAEGIRDAGHRAVALSGIAVALDRVADNEGLHLAWQLSEAIEDGNHKSKALSSVTIALAQVGDEDRLHRALTSMERIAGRSTIGSEESKAEAFHAFASIMAQNGAFDRAIAIAMAISSPQWKVEALSTIAKCLALTGQTRAAEELVAQAFITIESIESAYGKFKPLGTLTTALAQLMDQEGLRRVLSETTAIGDGETQAETLAKLIEALLQVQDREGLHRMLPAINAIKDKPARARTLEKLSGALGQIQDREQLHQVLVAAMEMSDWEEQQSHILSAVATAFGHLKDNPGLYQMLTATYTLKADWAKARVLEAIAHAFAYMSDREGFYQALAVAESIEGGANVKALCVMLRALSQVGDKPRLQQLLARARSMRSDDARCQIYVAAAQALAQVDEYEQAMTIVETLASDWNKAQAIANIAPTLARPGGQSCLRRALAIIESMADSDSSSFIESSFPKAEALGALASVLAQVGDREGLHQAWAIALAIRSGRGRAAAIAGVAAAFVGDTERLNEAIMAAAAIQDDLAKYKAFEKLVPVLVRCKDNGGLLKALSQAHTIATRYYREAVLFTIAKGQSALEQHDQALHTIRSIDRWSEMHAMSRDNLFLLLSARASFIAAIDRCQILWTLYEKLSDVESWWIPDSSS
jgi:AAA ATPase domain